VGMNDVVDKAAGQNFVWRADFAVPVGVGRALSNVKAQIDSNPATRDRVKLAYTEWLFIARGDSLVPQYTNLGGAIITAGWMNMLLENANFVPISDMTGLIEFGGIHKEMSKVYVTPQYWAFWLYSHYAGDTPVSSQTTVREYNIKNGVRRIPDIPNVPWLDVLATTDSHNHDLTLFVVNRDWEHVIPADLQLDGFVAASTAEVKTLTSDSVLTENDEFHPDRVHPVSSRINVPAGALHYKFPPHSLTVFIFSRR
jgi:alpha-N-arabinofuranosidase